jgi:hypothetical protein
LQNPHFFKGNVNGSVLGLPTEIMHGGALVKLLFDGYFLINGNIYELI